MHSHVVQRACSTARCADRQISLTRPTLISSESLNRQCTYPDLLQAATNSASASPSLSISHSATASFPDRSHTVPFPETPERRFEYFPSSRISSSCATDDIRFASLINSISASSFVRRATCSAVSRYSALSNPFACAKEGSAG